MFVAAAILSKVFARPITGLLGWGDRISASLLTGELGTASVFLSAEATSCPACESADGRLPESDRRKLPRAGTLPLAVLVCETLDRDATDETDVWRAVRDAGTAGGPIEVR